MDEWITRREAAAILGVHYNTIRGLEDRGELTRKIEMRNNIETVVYRRDQVEALRDRYPRLDSDAGGPSQAEILALRSQLAARDARIEELTQRLGDCDNERGRLLAKVLDS
jgi:MerR HTH family regulatory protein